MRPYVASDLTESGIIGIAGVGGRQVTAREGCVDQKVIKGGDRYLA